ncbi:hypothetical protein B9Z55_009868 [Caenorhabditis nigoni]|uniref:Uncharacterized protein n=2 Tax=Caenorhabditis nigoni TaxID=1611254 RepID=A0A2G5UTU1_9PELO|nr:hypothetical protein B9Z55_009868 [Caenorhabditis nigoni]
MSYERPASFKISLSKTMEVLSGSDDKLKNKRRILLEGEKFKLKVLSNETPEHTKMLYTVADRRNIEATLEKLKREVMDIHFVRTSEPRRLFNNIPVLMYSDCTGDRYVSEIKFKTKLEGCKPVDVQLVLKEKPKSIVFPNLPRQKYIQLRVCKNIPASMKLKESFDQWMSKGGLMIDFITESLWPAIKVANKQENQRKSKKEHDHQNSIQIPPLFPRAFSGSDRGPGRKFENRRDGRDNQRDQQLPSRRQHENGMMDKGAQIPRHKPQQSFNQPRLPRGGAFPSGPLEILGLRNQCVPSQTVGGSFGAPNKDYLAMHYSGSRENRSDMGRGHGRRGRGSRSRGPGGRGSDKGDWRKPAHPQ